jgi:chloramphenicol O-acetyltransferase type A
MKIEVQPQETPRAFAFEMWMTAPMPMAMLVKTMDCGDAARFFEALQKTIETL